MPVATLITRLWSDDTGGIITAEYVMVMGVVTGGAVAGAAVIRDSVVAGMTRLAPSVGAVVPDVEYTRRLVAVPTASAATVSQSQNGYTFLIPTP